MIDLILVIRRAEHINNKLWNLGSGCKRLHLYSLNYQNWIQTWTTLKLLVLAGCKKKKKERTIWFSSNKLTDTTSATEQDEKAHRFYVSYHKGKKNSQKTESQNL